MPTVKITSPHTTSVVISDLAKIAMRSYLSTHHLWSAQIFTNLAKAIEDEYEALDKRSGFDEHHRAYTLGAITCSAAFLEAAINEVYQDVADGHHGSQPLSERQACPRSSQRAGTLQT